MDFLGMGWIWIYIGCGLMFAELMAPGFIIFFFGLAAATVGALVLLLPDALYPNLTWQLALFTLFSIVYLVTLRRYMKNVFCGDFGGKSAVGDEYAGRLGKVTETIRPNLPGRVMIGDAEWTAVGDREMSVGTDIRVTARENLTMRVTPV